MLDKKGMSFIEVLISISILLGGLFAINMIWSGNFNRITKAQYQTNMSLFLYQKMAELEANYEKRKISQVPEKLTGDFGTSYPEYRWIFESQNMELPSIFQQILISQGEKSDQTLSMIKKIETFLSESVKEVRLTVFFKYKDKEISESLSTYFIEYQSFSLGLGGVNL